MSSSTSTAPYTLLAEFYDRFLTEDYDEWLEYLQSLWQAHGFAPHTVLDLACGTGNMTIPLADSGLTVTGVDQSSAMLALAKSKLREGLAADFVCQDMTKLSLGRTFDAAVSVCDGMNYLVNRTQFAAALRAAAEHVVPGGLFFFDLNSEWKLTHVYGDLCYAEVLDDLGLFWINEYEPQQQICTMTLTFFVQRSDGCYERYEERHRQKLWCPESVKQLLQDNGWSLVGFYGFGTQQEPGPECERWQFCARRC